MLARIYKKITIEKVRNFCNQTPPVVIGGIGGSGTRLVAQCMVGLGFFLGHVLNRSMDNLWFTLLFKRISILDSPDAEFDRLVCMFNESMIGSNRFSKDQVLKIKQLYAINRADLKETKLETLMRHKPTPPHHRWGWKEPNSHVVVHRLLEHFPGLKYIHVIRNGLDMAHSMNQNQLNLWGPAIIGNDIDVSPRNSLKFWCAVHKRILDLGKSMDSKFLLLKFEDFCQHPEKVIDGLSAFLGVSPTPLKRKILLELVRPPDSIGRFKQHGLSLFDKKDIAYVEQLGFDTTC